MNVIFENTEIPKIKKHSLSFWTQEYCKNIFNVKQTDSNDKMFQNLFSCHWPCDLGMVILGCIQSFRLFLNCVWQSALENFKILPKLFILFNSWHFHCLKQLILFLKIECQNHGFCVFPKWKIKKISGLRPDPGTRLILSCS